MATEEDLHLSALGWRTLELGDGQSVVFAREPIEELSPSVRSSTSSTGPSGHRAEALRSTIHSIEALHRALLNEVPVCEMPPLVKLWTDEPVDDPDAILNRSLQASPRYRAQQAAGKQPPVANRSGGRRTDFESPLSKTGPSPRQPAHPLAKLGHSTPPALLSRNESAGPETMRARASTTTEQTPPVSQRGDRNVSRSQGALWHTVRQSLGPRVLQWLPGTRTPRPDGHALSLDEMGSKLRAATRRRDSWMDVACALPEDSAQPASPDRPEGWGLARAGQSAV